MMRGLKIQTQLFVIAVTFTALAAGLLAIAIGASRSLADEKARIQHDHNEIAQLLALDRTSTASRVDLDTFISDKVAKLGVVEREMEASISFSRFLLIGFSAGLLLVATFLFLTVIRIRYGLNDVLATSGRMIAGDLTVRNAHLLADEFGRIEGDLNSLASALATTTRGRDLAEASLREMNAELEERARVATSRLIDSAKMAAMGELAAELAHEINNPLAFIRSNVSFAESEIRGDTLDTEIIGEVRMALADALSGIARLCEISSDLRGIARRGDTMESFDLGRAIESAVRIAKPTVSKHATITTAVEPGLSLEGSPSRLSQVFLNLLVNAGQAIEEAGVQGGVVSLQARTCGERIVVDIVDNGPGISPENLKRMSQPFFTTKPIGKGTGLGLSISREILAAHGASLEISSSIGHGAKFSMSFPARKVELALS